MGLSTQVNLANGRVSRTAQEGIFILLEVIKRHKEKPPESRTELTKLKTRILHYLISIIKL